MQTVARFVTKSTALLAAGAGIAVPAGVRGGVPAVIGPDHLAALLAPTVPAPSTYVLLATGVVGLAGALVLRRTRSA
ncbi:hypothetical protein tb265_14510 [Gemmatimonadetes bacterium T265]|nr:hypothetical protein tb265_14510 [Gemmatimonadetes bacterium T265]